MPDLLLLPIPQPLFCFGHRLEIHDETMYGKPSLTTGLVCPFRFGAALSPRCVRHRIHRVGVHLRGFPRANRVSTRTRCRHAAQQKSGKEWRPSNRQRTMPQIPRAGLAYQKRLRLQAFLPLAALWRESGPPVSSKCIPRSHQFDRACRFKDADTVECGLPACTARGPGCRLRGRMPVQRASPEPPERL